MKGVTNLRAFTRISTRVDLELRLSGSAKKFSGFTENVSMQGFAVEGVAEIPVGEIIDVVFLIEGLDSGARVEVKARIINIVGYRMGAEILSHQSMESYKHLERLVLYRSGDEAEVIEEEIVRQKKKA